MCLLFQDKTLIETTDQITEVASKFKSLENALRTAKLEEFSRNREQQDLKLTLNDVVFQVNKMKGKCFCWAPNLVSASTIPFHSGKCYMLFYRCPL